MYLIKCPNCQKEIRDDIYSCIYCGRELEVNNHDNNQFKAIVIPESIQFVEHNLYGVFKVSYEKLHISYLTKSFGKKEYIIRYNDIETLDLIIKPVPIAVKELRIILKNGSKFKFYIKKSNLKKWQNLVKYLKSDNLQFEMVDTSKYLNQYNNTTLFDGTSVGAFGVTVSIIIIVLLSGAVLFFTRPIDKRQACIISKSYVKDKLKNPSSAQFHNDCSVTEIDGNWVVSGTVSGMNGFGGYSSSSYSVTMKVNGNKYSIINISIH